jgi:hypothetical protein
VTRMFMVLFKIGENASLGRTVRRRVLFDIQREFGYI